MSNSFPFLLARELRTSAPTQILLNFCIALSLTLIVFLVAAERSKTSSITSCRAAAIALHYFVLATFMWMAVEAYNMYLCFVKILATNKSYFMTKCLIAGWGMFKKLKMKLENRKATLPQLRTVKLIAIVGILELYIVIWIYIYKVFP